MFNKDFREFVGLLNSIGVTYLIVGGYARAAYGHPRYTGDLNIWIRREPENVGKLLKALSSFGFGGLGLVSSDFLVPGQVVQLGYPHSRIDLLTSIDGVDFDTCHSSRMMVAIDGSELPFIGLKDFRTNKRASGRPKDLVDLATLDDGNQP